MADHANDAMNLADADRLVLWQSVAGVLAELAAALQGGRPDMVLVNHHVHSLAGSYYVGMLTLLWAKADALLAGGLPAEALRVTACIEKQLGPGKQGHCMVDVLRIRAVALERLGRSGASSEAWACAFAMANAQGLHGWINRWSRFLPSE